MSLWGLASVLRSPAVTTPMECVHIEYHDPKLTQCLRTECASYTGGLHLDAADTYGRGFVEKKKEPLETTHATIDRLMRYTVPDGDSPYPPRPERRPLPPPCTQDSRGISYHKHRTQPTTAQRVAPVPNWYSRNVLCIYTIHVIPRPRLHTFSAAVTKEGISAGTAW